MIRSPKVDYGLFRAYALPQSCPTFAIRGAPPPLLAHVGRAPSIILPLEQARCQNDTFGTVIIILIKDFVMHHRTCPVDRLEYIATFLEPLDNSGQRLDRRLLQLTVMAEQNDCLRFRTEGICD